LLQLKAVLWTRIRFESGFNGVPGSKRAKMAQKNIKVTIIISSFEALDVLF
jgi:hypothetical protein